MSLKKTPGASGWNVDPIDDGIVRATVDPVNGGVRLSSGGSPLVLGPAPIPTVLRTVFIGDSITAANSDQAFPSFGDSWACYMGVQSKGAVVLVNNSAIGGQKTIDMAARFDADVLAKDPNTVWIASGTNDDLDANGYPTDTEKYHVEMINKARAYRSKNTPYGCCVIMSTLTPFGVYGGAAPTPTSVLKQTTINNWKREFCARNGIPLIDFFKTTADSSGTFKNGYTTDAVHPLSSAQKAIGTDAWAEVSSLRKFTPTEFPLTNNDPTNLFANALFLSSSGNRPSGVGLYGNAAGLTESLGAEAGYAGNRYSIANGGGGSTYATAGTSTAPIPGNRYRITIQGNFGDVSFKWSGGPSNNVTAAYWKVMTGGEVAGGKFVTEVVAPPGVTGLYWTLAVPAGVTSKIAAVGMVDVTKAIA